MTTAVITIVVLNVLNVIYHVGTARRVRRLSSENQWLRRRLSGEQGSRAAARCEAAELLRSYAIRRAKRGGDYDAQIALNAADEIENKIHPRVGA